MRTFSKIANLDKNVNYKRNKHSQVYKIKIYILQFCAFFHRHLKRDF